MNDNPNKLDSADESDNDDAQSPSEVGREFAPIQTAYLQQLKATHRARARAAMRWRPRFLKALAMSFNWTDALKAARVCFNTVRAHERSDPEFAAQLKAAEQEGVELLHAVCWKAAMEGNVEPVYWQGKIVGEVRRYDNRLRIEMLRAYMPDKFKTRGAKVSLNSGNSPNVGIVMDAKEIEELVRLRQEALDAMKPKEIREAPNGASADSGNSSASVQ